MGLYDTFGDGIQIKAGPCEMKCYNVGDRVDDSYGDGIYIDPYGGLVVIKGGVFVAEFSSLDVVFDKWGGVIDLKATCGERNPLAVEIKEVKKCQT